MSRRRLFMCGPPGVGKSTVAALCAQRLGWQLVDTDAEIERRMGKSIGAIFASEGESRFRAFEAELTGELLEREDIVVATGGGLVCNTELRRKLCQMGTVICLTAPHHILCRRLGPLAAQGRPLLASAGTAAAGVSARLAALLASRALDYEDLPFHLDTAELSAAEVAARALDIARSEQDRLTVAHPAGAYDIVMGRGLLDSLGYGLAGRGYLGPVLIVSDDNVAPLYAQRVKQSLAAAGLDARLFVLPAGEATKQLQGVAAIYAACAAHGMERRSLLLALGGGVIGDVAGLAAATYLRGLPFVQVPTTLLAMADSSIGGKVGIDLPEGKNLVGAFHQPAAVFIDPDCLQTLPLRELRSGLAEILKAALISGGAPFTRIGELAAALRAAGFSDLPADRPPALPEGIGQQLAIVLRDALCCKRVLVMEDPFENGRRALLNLGHTFGHAIETWSNYTIRHGEAVAVGLLCAARLSQMLGLLDAAAPRELFALLEDLGLPTRIAIAHSAVATLVSLMQHDKKKKGGRNQYVLLRSPGDVFLATHVEESSVLEVLNQFL